MPTTIKAVKAREILDSRGNPTVEVDLTLQNGITARAAVPSGASTGQHEAVEIRDIENPRYNGKGVLQAVHNVNEVIGPQLIGKNILNQAGIDQFMIELDGLNHQEIGNKCFLGANAILGVSIAVARANALAQGIPLYQSLGQGKPRVLPVPMFNILNGGVHAHWQGPDFQEYMLVPYGAKSYTEALRWGAEVYHALSGILQKVGLNTSVGDEGGYVIQVFSNEKPLEFILQAIEKAGYQPGREIGIALDPASSSFYQTGSYHLKAEDKQLSAEEMVEKYATIIDNFPVIVLEDGLSEDDWEGWKLLNERLGKQIELVGDDLFVTNIERIQRGIDENVANAVLIKPNQIGTVTETIEAIHLAQKAGWGTMVSHRSGETVDTFIADLAVGLNCKHIKTGAPARGERVEKYNQLLRIEEELGKSAVFAGREAFVR